MSNDLREVVIEKMAGLLEGLCERQHGSNSWSSLSLAEARDEVRKWFAECNLAVEPARPHGWPTYAEIAARVAADPTPDTLHRDAAPLLHMARTLSAFSGFLPECGRDTFKSDVRTLELTTMRYHALLKLIEQLGNYSFTPVDQYSARALYRSLANGIRHNRDVYGGTLWSDVFRRERLK